VRVCGERPVDGLPGGGGDVLAGRPPARQDVGDLLARWEHTPGQDSK
jgi:hypothetical protein